jgi:hypothetical protein
MNRRIAAPVDEGAKYSSVAKPIKRATDSVVVKGQEFFVRHFTRRHREFAMSRPCDVSLNQ